MHLPAKNQGCRSQTLAGRQNRQLSAEFRSALVLGYNKSSEDYCRNLQDSLAKQLCRWRCERPPHFVKTSTTLQWKTTTMQRWQLCCEITVAHIVFAILL